MRGMEITLTLNEEETSWLKRALDREIDLAREKREREILAAILDQLIDRASEELNSLDR